MFLLQETSFCRGFLTDSQVAEISWVASTQIVFKIRRHGSSRAVNQAHKFSAFKNTIQDRHIHTSSILLSSLYRTATRNTQLMACQRNHTVSVGVPLSFWRFFLLFFFLRNFTRSWSCEQGATSVRQAGSPLVHDLNWICNSFCLNYVFTQGSVMEVLFAFMITVWLHF